MSTPVSARSGSGGNSSLRSDSDEACRLVAESGLRVSSLCRGGFFTTADRDEAEAAEAKNREAIDEAAALNAATLVLVAGGLPPGDRDLQAARDRAARAIERLVPYAHDHGVNLGIEPMNPIYAADRGVISTLEQASGHCRAFRRLPMLASLSTRSICGGNRVSPTSYSAPARTDRQLSDLRLDHSAAGGHPARPRHDGRRPHRLPLL